jgi:pyruvate/2-oxoglutarate dehydrogenase complex dihydrolipoamide acyltransferase (E2) component
MATSTKQKPATTEGKVAKAPQQKPAAKPAAEKPAVAEGLTLRDLAEKVGKDPKAVRRQIRKIRGGAQVGQGGRYHWTSESDPDFKELVVKLTSK